MKRYVLLLLFIALVIVLYPTTNGVHYFNIDKVLNREGVKILNFGDVMFDRGVRNIIKNRGRDPFEYIKKDLSLLEDNHVFIVNLEGPIVVMDRSLCQQKAYNFQFAPDTTDRLKSIGVNMVSIANNHSYDCLKKGFESTKKYLNEAGIDYIGDSVLENSFVVKEISGKKVAFVGIDETVQIVPLSSFYPLVKKLKTENDLVVVNIHWGKEYLLQNDDNQKAIAYRLIDNGADVIFGHHPHVVQNMEVYKGKAIFYSLGNFVFDQNFGDTTVGLGVKAEFKDKETVFELFPFNIKVFAPDLMKGEEKVNFCNKFLVGLGGQDCRFEIKI